MKTLLFLAGIGIILAGCANQQYAGVNYGDVTLPNGEHWIIAGGKDETNVSFEVKRADGTTAKYVAESANASAVMAEMVKLQSQQMQMMQTLVGLVPVP
ncbi:MAG: hypothetical protein WAT93_14745 [Pontixanthobacter sp.]